MKSTRRLKSIENLLFETAHTTEQYASTTQEEEEEVKKKHIKCNMNGAR